MKKKKATKQVNKAVCVLCGKEEVIKGRAILPDGWTFSDPDVDGLVEPKCNQCG